MADTSDKLPFMQQVWLNRAATIMPWKEATSLIAKGADEKHNLVLALAGLTDGQRAAMVFSKWFYGGQSGPRKTSWFPPRPARLWGPPGHGVQASSVWAAATVGRPPFGANQSPRVFVELTPAVAIFQAGCDGPSLQVKIFVYVVCDFMALGLTHAEVQGAFDVMDEI
ncbi:hypothetical protein VaNZ11_012225 [Volvox africanus]|uniref:Uncharacterized protein n=1 Tax=Volvox africanus TaxID=51714 RepID=A0ABQ5SDC3_9CHLO|nr:hypothetical protein VaNZ11_012225 [Volvox africanus]